MSYRELWVFIKHLPADSWTQTLLRDEADTDLEELVAPEGPTRFGPWALHNYQIAALTDAVNALAYKVHVSGGLQPEPEVPEPTPRPGLRRSRVVQQLSPELAQAQVLYLNKIRAKG